MGIYVEIRVRAPMSALWEHTQNPTLHERWDLRFSTIDYLPKTQPGDPQRFRYATRLGLGLEVAGEGESTGDSDRADGSRVSALKFWSADLLALIREGGGYWQYIPTADGIRFLTWYDYRTRFGRAGRAIDRLAFRPLLGWATAWSFDRLRLWLEEGLDPSRAFRQWLVHALSRLSVASVWIYHGVVPKLIARHADEIALVRAAGVSEDAVAPVLIAAGAAEIGLGLTVLVCWRQRWPLGLTIVLMAAALFGVAVTAPQHLSAAFNPVSLNLSVACLAAVGWLTCRGLPEAAHCVRRRPAVDA